ncbi:hypothetical protein COY23_00015 [bacterium (Candidatus Torokbacteria) CG_4_10_14_0_2_um_filter_35_8]|nr:MAG: hypothetical protein COY23_00015 [bacterium (Candidatus Torokbacteria) CG_4_10_14_0_2_um_filter_35_8]
MISIEISSKTIRQGKRYIALGGYTHFRIIGEGESLVLYIVIPPEQPPTEAEMIQDSFVIFTEGDNKIEFTSSVDKIATL